jgi:hypothetical protein
MINEELLDIKYFRHLIRTEPFRQLLALASPGGAGRNKTLNRSDLLRFEVHLRPLSRQKAIAELLNLLDRRISLLNRHIFALARERDSLTTRLLIGRLRVPKSCRLNDRGVSTCRCPYKTTRSAQEIPLPFHSHQQFLAEPGRTVLCPDYRTNDSPRNLPQHRRTGEGYLQLAGNLERRTHAVV